MKNLLPWPAKIAAKIVLSRIPVPFSTWRRIGVFRHGHMNTGSYALEVFRTHCRRLAGGVDAGVDALSGKTVMELGPGDSIATGLLAHLHGAAASVLIDSDAYAERNPAIYETMLDEWEAEGLSSSRLRGCATFELLCERSGTRYLHNGLDSLAALPDGAVDLGFSNAVLEHIRLADFEPMLTELRRVLSSPDGAWSHTVDLRDHLGGALNNLRFSRRLWESRFFAESGFYTNRIRYRQMLSMFERAGFVVDVLQTTRFPALPTLRIRMWKPFRDCAEEDLLVSSFNIVLRPHPGGPDGLVSPDVLGAAGRTQVDELAFSGWWMTFQR